MRMSKAKRANVYVFYMAFPSSHSKVLSNLTQLRSHPHGLTFRQQRARWKSSTELTKHFQVGGSESFHKMESKVKKVKKTAIN